MENGNYRTMAGSTVELSGKHSGISKVSFDWFEESGACCDCVAMAYPADGYLVWHCSICGSGQAKLERA